MQTLLANRIRWANATGPLFIAFTLISPSFLSSLSPLARWRCPYVFFVGYLALRPRIWRYTTVRSYLCHVRALWRDAGCPDNLLCSPLLKVVMRGVRRALPAPHDAREAFVLPHYTPPSYYLNPP